MASADFFRCTRHPKTSPGKSFFLPPIPAASTMGCFVNWTLQWCACLSKSHSLICRFCSSVPDFVVSLPSVHWSPNTTLRLTNASDTTPRIRDLHPLEKNAHSLFCSFESWKLICIFRLFLELTTSVRSCSCRAHTTGIKHAGFSGCATFRPALWFVTVDTFAAPQSATFHTANVGLFWSKPHKCS